MTRAELLAEYIGMTPNEYIEHYDVRRVCNRCKRDPYACSHHSDAYTKIYTLDMPDPMRSGHEADAWLGPLLRWKHFVQITQCPSGVQWRAEVRCERGTRFDTPVAAIVNAMLAADPDFHAKWETCDD